MTTLVKPRLFKIPRFEDPRGNLSVVQEYTTIPFKIERVFWIYDVPGGQSRGGHAFKTQIEFILPVSGSFDVILDDGIKERKFKLACSYIGLLVPIGYWRRMENFTTNSVALVLCSTTYSNSDYIRDYDEFLEFRQHLNDNSTRL